MFHKLLEFTYVLAFCIYHVANHSELYNKHFTKLFL